MQRSISHHWIPQFHLKRWQNDEGRLVSFFLDESRRLVRKPTPRNIACEDDLYTVFSKEGQHLYREEEIFKKVDQEGADAIKFFLEKDWRITTNETADRLCRFLFLLAARHPTVRDLFYESQVKVFGQVRQEAQDRGEDPDSSAFFRDLETKFVTDRDRATLLMTNFAIYPDLAYKELFNNIIMLFEDTGAHGKFLTSDMPLISMPHIGAPTALYIFPMSPDRVVLMSHSERILATIQKLSRSAFISWVNLAVVLFAEHYVYSTSDRDQDVIFKHLGRSKRYTEDEFTSVFMDAYRGGIELGVYK